MADPRALLITGATGFVGAALAVELLRARRSDLALCLVRAGSDADARRRLEASLRDAGAAYGVPPDEIADVVARAIAVRGDLTAPGLGLDAATTHRLRKAGPLHVFHAAASLKDTEEALREIVAHNVVGTERVLDTLLPLGVAAFNHVSTAYVCGRRTRDIPEEVERPRGFHNRYEQSKHYGEALVVDHCRAAGVPWRILRPSIVVGHSRTARATGYTGFLGWVLKLAGLADVTGGALATRRLGYVCRADAEVNIIPIDSVVEDIVGIDRAGAATEDRVFHLTNREAPVMHTLVAQIAGALGLAGVDCLPPSTLDIELDPIAAKFHRWTRFERPYVAGTREFRRDGDTLYASPRHGAAPIDGALIARMTAHTAAYARSLSTAACKQPA
jgi:nucleoside-diphosphate-sugar epimerase